MLANPTVLTDGTVTLTTTERAGDRHSFAVERDDTTVGTVSVDQIGAGTGVLTWQVDEAHRTRSTHLRVVRLVTDWAMTEEGQGGLGLGRVEARIPSYDEESLRAATRAGLRREGLTRQAPEHRTDDEHVLLARLSDDPPVSDPASFRSLLNSFLPRKRAIGQMLIRDRDGRILLCQLTYKRDWDLPGGVVEVSESPRSAVSRELKEELALDIAAGPLVLTDWMPPWGGWDDAVCLLFDGGIHDAALVDRIDPEEREIRTAEFLTLEQVHERAADFTARRIVAALAALDGGPTFSESGRTEF